MRGQGHRCSQPWARGHQLWAPDSGMEHQTHDHAKASNPRYHRRTMESELSLRHLHQGQTVQDPLQQHTQSRRRSRHNNTPCCGGFWVFHSWGCCCLYLVIVSDCNSTKHRHERSPSPSSCMLVFPIIIAPASSHCFTHHEVPSEPCLKSSFDPSVRLYPVRCTSSFTATGTPSRGPNDCPFLYRSVEISAAARIASA